MVVKVVVGFTVFLVATIAVARGIRAADWTLPVVLSAGFLNAAARALASDTNKPSAFSSGP